MNNWVAEGKTLDYTVSGADIVAGQPRWLGGVLGVAVDDGAVGERVAMGIDAVYNLEALSSDSWARGDRLHFVIATELLTDTVGSNPYAGVAMETKATAATNTRSKVRVNFGHPAP